MQPIQGIHHITAFAKDPQANADFYHRVLGQRLVKTTVNFDDPGTYHLYFGDAVGSPGTIMTFFPWPHAAQGQAGNGEVAATAYTIRPNSVAFWQNRLHTHNIVKGELQERFGETVLPFLDPHGTPLELVTSRENTTIDLWEQSNIPDEHAIRGFHSATLWVDRAELTAAVLVEQLGLRFIGQDGSRYRYQAASNNVGSIIDLLERPGRPRGRSGHGTIHHIAFRTVDDTEQADYLAALRAGGLQVTPVQDRQYFHSIYFREPNGVLFEVATDAPGFLYDEPRATLGQSLKLPQWYEGHRPKIEQALPSLTYPSHHQEAA